MKYLFSVRAVKQFKPHLIKTHRPPFLVHGFAMHKERVAFIDNAAFLFEAFFLKVLQIIMHVNATNRRKLVGSYH